MISIKIYIMFLMKEEMQCLINGNTDEKQKCVRCDKRDY